MAPNCLCVQQSVLIARESCALVVRFLGMQGLIVPSLSDGDQDQMVEELAKNMNWMRCPSCKYYIEKSYGCNIMKCSN
ncbi:hypothetical protein GBA52_023029 [Prunus armeniaca]|nr:hypothetical protein GBA52_023029 [Prunus armeniaca]